MTLSKEQETTIGHLQGLIELRLEEVSAIQTLIEDIRVSGSQVTGLIVESTLTIHGCTKKAGCNYHEASEFLKAVSTSRISLDGSKPPKLTQIEQPDSSLIRIR